ncbi:hypothetical protein E2562_037556 [Oryza meyeriana var. granulata]|uniref:Uncharacterized protein n=1 Tax=Oryza meyeriana var. granulata TaxID=110450 RepID=A0A6G1E7W3_9ORYZ|nr:hypothetical protein E2562_037556 [Oryza meyeriana var. granulata]
MKVCSNATMAKPHACACCSLELPYWQRQTSAHQRRHVMLNTAPTQAPIRHSRRVLSSVLHLIQMSETGM